jgi:type IV pilus assembly protein PilC
MPLFEYSGKNTTGAPVSGTLNAKNRQDLERILRRRRILVTEVSKKPSQINISFGTKKIKKIDISRFTRQFATMISAGLPMVQCLEILAQQSENPEMRRVINEIKESVQGGATLSESMARHKKAFDDLYVNMVEAGEVGGALDVILVRLAIFREKADALVRKVKGAMVYPVVVMIVAIGVTIGMLTFIVPVFAKMFQNLGTELPAPTQVILAISHGLKSNAVNIIVGIIAFIFAYKWYIKSPSGRLNVDKIKLRIPLIGDLIRKSSVSRFTRTLSTLLSSGVAILEALEITAKTSGNVVVQNAIKKSVVSIAEGETITAPLRESGVFPPMVTQMISVGEKTGGLDEMLSKIADFYDEEVDAAVAALTSVIEPIIIVFLGVVMGGILIAMYLPMFDIIGKIG